MVGKLTVVYSPVCPEGFNAYRHKVLSVIWPPHGTRSQVDLTPHRQIHLLPNYHLTPQTLSLRDSDFVLPDDLKMSARAFSLVLVVPARAQYMPRMEAAGGPADQYSQGCTLQKMEAAEELEDVECKVVLVGDSRCGKTALVQRFVGDNFVEVGIRPSL